jgi:hypothetical protein
VDSRQSIFNVARSGAENAEASKFQTRHEWQHLPTSQHNVRNEKVVSNRPASPFQVTRREWSRTTGDRADLRLNCTTRLIQSAPLIIPVYNWLINSFPHSPPQAGVWWAFWRWLAAVHDPSGWYTLVVVSEVPPPSL